MIFIRDASRSRKSQRERDREGKKTSGKTGRSGLRGPKSFGFRGFPRGNVLWSIATLNQRGSRAAISRNAALLNEGKSNFSNWFDLTGGGNPAIGRAFDSTLHPARRPSPAAVRPAPSSISPSSSLGRSRRRNIAQTLSRGSRARLTPRIRIRPCSRLFDFSTFPGRSLSSSNLFRESFGFSGPRNGSADNYGRERAHSRSHRISTKEKNLFRSYNCMCRAAKQMRLTILIVRARKNASSISNFGTWFVPYIKMPESDRFISISKTIK